MPHASGWSELDLAMAAWESGTAALPADFRTELFDTLIAVERGETTLMWESPSPERPAMRERFPHPFAGTFDQTMLYLSLSLGLAGPKVRMLPIGGVILQKNFGAPNKLSAEATADADELATLRGLLAHVTSSDPPPG